MIISFGALMGFVFGLIWLLGDTSQSSGESWSDGIWESMTK
tara:strand:- start:397 stop:519 length:123 start_codon:yes stop_codon:yes gene_type:complete